MSWVGIFEEAIHLVKLPEGKSLGFLFNITSGNNLDVFARRYGLKRKKWFIFREFDRSYKNRIIEAALKEEEAPTNQ